MIDHDLTQAFPPVWVAESRDTDVLFPWLADPVAADAASALLVAQGGDGAVITSRATDGGSSLFSAPSGMVLRLSASDAASMKDRLVLLAVWLDGAVMMREPDATGVVIVSDWAAEPARGTA